MLFSKPVGLLVEINSHNVIFVQCSEVSWDSLNVNKYFLGINIWIISYEICHSWLR